MCDVHLIETARHTGQVKEGTACCYCGRLVRGEVVVVEGHLDDGSPGLHRFAYHEDCAWDMEHDLDEIDAHEGCFSYGAAFEVIHPTKEGSPQ